MLRELFRKRAVQGFIHEMDPRIRFIALVGASASGKSTLVQQLLNRDTRLQRMTSITTRDPRDSDAKGEYDYLSSPDFEQRCDAGEFAWDTGLHSNRYGYLRASFEEALCLSVPTVMHLEPKCVPRLLEIGGDSVFLIFVTATRTDLVRRLSRRDRKKPESYYKDRIETCLRWEEEARVSGLPYHFVHNADGKLEHTVARMIQELTTKKS